MSHFIRDFNFWISVEFDVFCLILFEISIFQFPLVFFLFVNFDFRFYFVQEMLNHAESLYSPGSVASGPRSFQGGNFLFPFPVFSFQRVGGKTSLRWRNNPICLYKRLALRHAVLPEPKGRRRYLRPCLRLWGLLTLFGRLLPAT